jgi:cytochrome c oxidase cbb3-type subunit 3
MKRLTLISMSVLLSLFFFENCSTTRNTTAVSEDQVWGNIVLDSKSIILEIANNDEHVEEGQQLFKQYCSICHGAQAKGGIGPDLTDDSWLHGGSKIDIARTIVDGVPARGMRRWKSLLTPIEVGEVVAYVSSLGGTDSR